MTVQQIDSVSVLDAIWSGAHTRDDIAARFGALSTSRFLTDGLADLASRGLVVDQGVCFFLREIAENPLASADAPATASGAPWRYRPASLATVTSGDAG